MVCNVLARGCACALNRDSSELCSRSSCPSRLRPLSSARGQMNGAKGFSSAGRSARCSHQVSCEAPTSNEKQVPLRGLHCIELNLSQRFSSACESASSTWSKRQFDAGFNLGRLRHRARRSEEGMNGNAIVGQRVFWVRRIFEYVETAMFTLCWCLDAINIWRSIKFSMLLVVINAD
eukprot:6191008-Pleurochrysis_carterae.AAC.3